MSPKKKKESPFEHQPKSSWEAYGSQKHRKAMDAAAKRYLKFLSDCKTEREVVAHVAERAAKAGFADDIGSGKWMRVFRGKTVLLARKGKRPMSEGFRLVGAHADSPRLDLKQHPLYEDCGVGLAKTHYYGGIRKHQWLARPLALHGVAVKKDGTVVPIAIGEDPDDPVFAVDDLLPHLAHKQVTRPVSEAFEAEKLNVILGHEPLKDGDEKNNRVKARILKILNDRYGLVEADLFSAELQAVPAGPARWVGLDEAMIGGYGHDDRACVFTALEAFLAEEDPEHCQMVLFWDKEEIGSEGSTGAKSMFFEYCLDEMVRAWDPGTTPARACLAGKALSGDVHAAMNPDYQDVHEKLNSAYVGYGPSFCKFTGHRGKVGANDAHPEYVAWLRGIMDKAKVPWQMAELGKVDLGGGGTVAKFLAVYGMDVIDIGPPVLTMHSPFELVGKSDIYATIQAFRTFLKS